MNYYIFSDNGKLSVIGTPSNLVFILEHITNLVEVQFISIVLNCNGLNWIFRQARSVIDFLVVDISSLSEDLLEIGMFFLI